MGIDEEAAWQVTPRPQTPKPGSLLPVQAPGELSSCVSSNYFPVKDICYLR